MRVTLRLTTQPNAVVVPNQAVQTGQEGPFVFVVKTDRVAVLFPADIRGHRGFQPMLAQLFEKRSAELRIVERRCTEADQGIPMSALESGVTLDCH